MTPYPVMMALIASGKILASADIAYPDWLVFANFGMQHQTLPSNHFLINFIILMLHIESTPTLFLCA